MKEKFIFDEKDLTLTDSKIKHRCIYCNSSDLRPVTKSLRYHVKRPKWLRYVQCQSCKQIMCDNNVKMTANIETETETSTQ